MRFAVRCLSTCCLKGASDCLKTILPATYSVPAASFWTESYQHADSFIINVRSSADADCPGSCVPKLAWLVLQDDEYLMHRGSEPGQKHIQSEAT